MTREPADLFASLIKTNADRALSESLLSYAKALRSYNDRSYFLGTFAGTSTAASIYVPLKGRQNGSDLDDDVERSAGRKVATGSRRILLEGGPGSGKSTVLRELARYSWSEPDRVGLGRGYIALPIKLRSLAEAEGITREDRLWSALEKAQELDVDGARPLMGFLEQWSEAMDAPWLFLLDGYDEISGERGPEILQWAMNLAREHDVIVVTSRPNAIPQQFTGTFEKLELNPFDDAQQVMLATAWFGDRCDDFLQAFRSTAPGELGGTPLLLTIAASVYKEEGALPRRRSELYRHFSNIVMREALRRMGAKLPNDLHESASVLIPKYLALLARAMSEGQERGASLDFGSDPRRLILMMAEGLRSDLGLMMTVAEQRAGRLYEFIGTHSGILRATEHHFEWLHPTFREYFTAEALLGSRDRSGIEAMLSRPADPSWRQVILFFIALNSERGPVDEWIEALMTARPPLGAALAGVALSEGADVSSWVAQNVLQNICDGVRQLGEGWICERLLTADAGAIGQLRGALLLLRDYPGGGAAIEALNLDLEKLAVAFGKDGANAIEDLRELQAVQSLLRLADEDNNPLPVRLDAAAALCKIGRNEEGGAIVLRLVRAASREHTSDWPKLAGALNLGGPNLLARFGAEPTTSDLDWATALDSIAEDGRPQVLRSLSEDARLSAPARMAVRLREMNSTTEAMSLVGSVAASPPLLRACIEVLRRNGSRLELLEIIRDSWRPRGVRAECLRALKALADVDGLLAIVQDPDLDFLLKRRAAEAAFQSTLVPQQAQALADWFGSLPQSEKPSLLRRRAQGLYQAQHPEDALPLFERWLPNRVPPNMVRLMYAHSLEQVGRIDEALQVFEEAEDLAPGLVFANCRKAMILFDKGRYIESADAVEKVWPIHAPDWFHSNAFRILKKAGRPEAAGEWLRDQDWLVVAYHRASLEMDKGNSNTALKLLRSWLAQNEDLGVELEIGFILRTRGHLEGALAQFAKVGKQDFITVAPEQADVLIRLGRYAEADECIAALRASLPDEPYFDYLAGLSKTYQGDHAALNATAQRCLSSSVEALHDMDTNWQLPRLLLFALAAGRDEIARTCMSRLVQERECEQLRNTVIPHLDTLAGALGDSTAALLELRKQAANVALPKGLDADDPEAWRRDALYDIQRNPYPFPMYCQKHSIDGLEQDKELAVRILQASDRTLRSIVLWTLGRQDRVYGHCNFAKDDGGEWFKFCDETQTVLRTNLEFLTTNLGVRRLMFLQKDLQAQFEFAAKRNRLPLECVLIDPPGT